jgi:hypothetical protein
VAIPGHKGPHPLDYHREIFRRLTAACNNGGKAGLEKELEDIKKEATTPGCPMNKVLTKT